MGISKCECGKCNCSYFKMDDEILCSSCKNNNHMNFLKRFELWLWRKQIDSELKELDLMKMTGSQSGNQE